VEPSKYEKGEQLSLPFDGRQQPMPAPVLLTERQVCELLGIGRTTLRSLPLRPKHINRCVRYLATDVEQYVAELT
jgi:predicted DNA-binding transcriptional regulator AlpA